MIFGLYLDGARWDPEGGCLSDSLPGQRFSKLPEIHFKPVQVSCFYSHKKTMKSSQYYNESSKPSLFTKRTQRMLLHGNSDDSDQPGPMPRLI